MSGARQPDPALKERSRVRAVRTVFPADTNHHGTLFGGAAIQLMAETAFVAGTRYTRTRLVLVSSGRIDFHLPVPPGAIIELEAEVEALGASSLVIHCVIRREQIGREGQQEVAAGRFTFVAVDEAMRPVEIP